MELQEAVIVSGARTPVGRFGGAFKDVAAPTSALRQSRRLWNVLASAPTRSRKS